MGANFSCFGLLGDEETQEQGDYEAIPLRQRGNNTEKQMELDSRRGQMAAFIGL